MINTCMQQILSKGYRVAAYLEPVKTFWAAEAIIKNITTKVAVNHIATLGKNILNQCQGDFL